jgi:hypothetical protein
VPGLAARFAPALLPRRAPAALWARHAVGGRGLGRIGGIPLAPGQFPFQIGDLLSGIGDLLFSIGDLLSGIGDLLIPFGYLLISFGYLLTEFLNLTLLPLDLPPQFFPSWHARMLSPCLLVACAPSGPCIHPPYVKLFREVCPEQSVRVLELPQKQGREQLRIMF